MKRLLLNRVLAAEVKEGIAFVWIEWRRQKLPLVIFLVICLNLLVAPVVYAAVDSSFERRHAWTIGLLGLVTLGLLVYLFDVVFRPERY